MNKECPGAGPPKVASDEARSTSPLHTQPPSPVFVRADGVWLFDSRGRPFFDATAGSGACSLGHQHPEVQARAEAQASRLVHTGWNYQSDTRAELASALCRFVPFSDAAVLLAVTGAEAVEAALKVARAATGRTSVVAFNQSFHGKTAGALAVTWRRSFREHAACHEADVRFAPWPNGEDGCTARCLDALIQTIARLCEQRNPPAAIILDPLQISEGVWPAPTDFRAGVHSIAREAGSLVIYDEIYSGFGRGGDRFVARANGLSPDLMAIGKALGNGFPISAVVGDRELLNALPPGHHTSTFTGHPISCAAAVAVLDLMERLEPWVSAAASGRMLVDFLHSLSVRTGVCSPPRAQGLAIGFDCLSGDGQPSGEAARRFATIALDCRLLVRYGGAQGCTIKLSPSLLLTEQETNFLCDRIGAVTAQMLETSHAVQ